VFSVKKKSCLDLCHRRTLANNEVMVSCRGWGRSLIAVSLSLFSCLFLFFSELGSVRCSRLFLISVCVCVCLCVCVCVCVCVCLCVLHRCCSTLRIGPRSRCSSSVCVCVCGVCVCVW